MRSLTYAFMLSVATISAASALEMTEIASFEIGKGEGFAEIIKYHKKSQSVIATASKTGTLEIVSLADVTQPVKNKAIDLAGGNVTSVAVHGDLIAAAIVGEGAADISGSVKIFNRVGQKLAEFETGALPDNLAFSPDGAYLLTANEGEPSDDYKIDPQGSFTLIDLSKGLDNAIVSQILLTDVRLPRGARIVTPKSRFAVDAEPEFVAMSPDSQTAYVVMQENNAMAVIDLPNARLKRVFGLGFKDASLQSYDLSNKDGGIQMKSWPVTMIYQPDSIAAYQVNGQTYLVGANEGDAKDYEGFSEETRVAKLTLDAEAFPNAAELQKPENLGRLKTTTTLGDHDGDGDHDQIFSYGARSFSIWNSQGQLQFDSGNQFEAEIAKRNPEMFNANGSQEEMDDRSDDKGPEPESLTIGQIDGRHYAFIGMERNNALFAYDISNPNAAKMVGYQMPGTQHNSPEGLVFVSAEDSPSGKPLLLAAFEMTGTLAVYEIQP